MSIDYLYLNEDQFKRLRERAKTIVIKNKSAIDEYAKNIPQFHLNHIGCGGEFIKGKCNKCNITLAEIWGKCGGVSSEEAAKLANRYMKVSDEIASRILNSYKDWRGILKILEEPSNWETSQMIKVEQLAAFEGEKEPKYSITGMPDTHTVEYWGQLTDNKFFIVYRPKEDWDYTKFFLLVGNADSYMMVTQVFDVSRARDGGTTHIKSAIGEFCFPSCFTNPRTATLNRVAIKVFNWDDKELNPNPSFEPVAAKINTETTNNLTPAENWTNAQIEKFEAKIDKKELALIDNDVRAIKYHLCHTVANGDSYKCSSMNRYDGSKSRITGIGISIETKFKEENTLHVGDYVKHKDSKLGAAKILSYDDKSETYFIKGVSINGWFVSSNLIKITQGEALETVFGKTSNEVK